MSKWNGLNAALTIVTVFLTIFLRGTTQNGTVLRPNLIFRPYLWAFDEIKSFHIQIRSKSEIYDLKESADHPSTRLNTNTLCHQLSNVACIKQSRMERKDRDRIKRDKND